MMSRIFWAILVLPWQLVRGIWRILLWVLKKIWRTVRWPFRRKGVARQRLVLTLLFLVSLLCAVIAYPLAWNRPAAALKPHVEAWGSHLADRTHTHWPKRAGEVLSPEQLPTMFLGRDISQYALGLDLVGGAHLEYAIDTSKLSGNDVSEALAALRATIERRVNIFGVREPVVQLSKSGGQDRLIVELSGITDLREAVAKVGDPIFLEFREENQNVPENIPDFNALFKPTPLTGQYLKRADVVFDQTTNQPQVQITFNDEGAKLFQDLTKRSVGKRIAIFIDGYPVTAPTVQQEIIGGTAVITGTFTVDEAKALSRNLNAGALPVPIDLIAQRTVGATLGAQSLHEMVRAGLATLVIIAAFMILLYRLPGLLALLALVMYTAFMLALFKIVPITMTLAGVAGVILSVGMAVDANILIFARMREERKGGKPPIAAVDAGFKRAWLAIRDSNVSTMLTTFILYAVGTSFVQGFALALFVGVLVSMLTAVYISRYLLQEAARHPWLTKRRFLW